MDGTSVENETVYANGVNGTIESENHTDAMFELIAGNNLNNEDVLKTAIEANNNNNNDGDNNNNGSDNLTAENVETDVSIPAASETNVAATTASTTMIATKPACDPSRSGKLVMDYSTDFPKLPDVPPAAINGAANAASASVWSSRPMIKSTEVTEAFKLSPAERASRGYGKFGNTLEEQQKCNVIASATGTKIELCEAKDQSLTILITGKRANVDEARSRLVRELQTQCCVQVQIPKEFHGHIIGTKGQKLRQLENEFLCQIAIPGRDEASNIIRVCGPAEYIEGAARRIREIGDQMARQGSDTLSIPRDFYPWIRGPFDETIDRIIADAPGAKINIPPPTSKNETIVINGERTDVEKAAAQLRAIYAEKKASVTTLTCKVPKAQHRFIIGVKRIGIDEILKETDVAVDVPPEDGDSDVVTLRGSPNRLGDALALVYSKASSVISQELRYPEWMRRFLIGPKGTTLNQLVPNQEKLKMDFEDGGVIYLEGSPDVVKAAYTALNNEVHRLSKDLASEVVHAPPALHRHIIGRNGSNVNKLKEDYNVQIIIPNETNKSDEIRIEGNKDGVKKAADAIKEIITRLENEKSRDIIIEHRFHGQVIGKSGENMQKWRQQFPTVSITFPEVTEKSDIVNLRGDRKEVDSLYSVMHKLVKELIESNYQESVPIFKEYFKHIIGKNGANINRIRDETKTRVELPPQGSSGRITVIGKQANVEKAIHQLNKIQNELASIVTAEVSIPSRIHNRLLDNGRRLIRDVEDEFGGVHIQFPKEKCSDKVIIRGPKDNVAAAEKALKEVAKHCEQTTEELIVKAKPEYFKFLIGRDGSKLRKLREQYPTVRVVFPSEDQVDNSNIILLGKKEEVAAVQKLYEKQIVELNETVEISLNVDQQFHRHFIMRGAEVLKEIQSQNGNCQISFPRQDANDVKVVIKGSKTCAESAKARIEEIVDDLTSQVTIDVEVSEVHHRSLIPHLNDLRSQYNVRIKVPDRRQKNENGELPEGTASDNTIQITGRDTKCEAAKKALINLIPITKTVSVPLEYHRTFIGRGGESVRALMSTYAIRVKIPSSDEKNEEITISGTEENVDAAIEEVRKRVAEWDGEAEDRKLRSFKLSVDVASKYHQRLIGARGTFVQELMKRHNDVQVSIPRSDSNSETITITGYEADCNSCREEIEKIIADLESMIAQEVALDQRFHPRLIGQRGRNLRKVEEEFAVEIRMPGRNDSNSEKVVVMGSDENNVYNCIEYLRNAEEDFISEMIERGIFEVKRSQPAVQVQEEQVAANQMEITGAPWQLDSMEQFPAMGSTSAPVMPAAAGVWGQRRW